MYKITRIILSCVLSTFILSACSQNNDDIAEQQQAAKTKEIQQRWAQYLGSHTNGVIPRKSPIKFFFTSNIITDDQIGVNQPDLVTTKPDIDFDAIFNSAYELTILPKEPLPPGQKLEITLHPRALSSLPTSLENYTFSLQTIEPHIRLIQLQTDIDPVRQHHVIVRGELQTSDETDAGEVETISRLTLANQPVTLNWTHSQGTSHVFVTDAIAKTDTDQLLIFNFGGKPFMDEPEARELTISSRSSFNITQANRLPQSPNTIQFTFSETLDKAQNLKGLIRISQGSFTTRIEENHLLVQLDQGVVGNVQFAIDASIRSSTGRAMGKEYNQTFVFESYKPEVRFVDAGSMLTPADKLFLPVDVMNASAIHVYAFQVYDSNLVQFFQQNDLNSANNMHRLGRFLWRKTLNVGAGKVNQWQRVGLDVSELYREKPNAIFHFKVLITRNDSLYPCPPAAESELADKLPEIINPDQYVNGDNNWSFVDQSGDLLSGYYSYDWYQNADACSASYFHYSGKTLASRNFVAANIGIIAKAGRDGKLHIVTTNIQTGEPLSGAKIELYSLQGQKILDVDSNSEGKATVSPPVKPLLIIATQGKQRGYLRLSEASVLATSHFDVSGETSQQGVKGMIYGERDVWRPGDTLYLTFVLQDLLKVIPDDHPATIELFNPKQQKIYTQTNITPLNGFYKFAINTSEKDLTGDWNAVVHLGNRRFDRRLKIETIMPNRLKMELRAEGDFLGAQSSNQLNLFSQWLHGATANGLRAEVRAKLRKSTTQFKQFDKFIFDDPARQQYGSTENVWFDGELDAEGKAVFSPEISTDQRAPGMMKADVTTRVFEPGGAFSIGGQSILYSPYARYVGMLLPAKSAYEQHPVGKPITVQVATVSETGKAVSTSKLELSLYRIDWSWWWSRGENNLARYDSANAPNLVLQKTLATKDGKTTADITLDESWARYMLRICDAESGHCTGQIFYSGWDEDSASPQFAANLLMLSTDKEHYKVGETARLQLPIAQKGRALLSLENGTEVIEQRWITLDGKRSIIEIPVDARMAPNIYATVTLIQPQSEKTNDRPIRLFGITPIIVSNPDTELKPVLDTASEVRPQSTLKIKVTEQEKRRMTYTLAVVDEGLLGLTNFKTPKLHESFYRREALGVKTWDMFDQVVGAYGASLEKLLALGGSDAEGASAGKRQQNRFLPVVRFIGPFELAAGKSAEHEIALPAYLGAVRVMLIAGQDGAYGSAEKEVRVTQPLMVQATLPRVIGPGEDVTMPLSVFVLKDSIREVTIQAEASDLLQALDSKPVKLQFNGTGDKLGFIRFKVRDAVGDAKVKIIASAGNERIEQVINIAVRAHNVPSNIRASKLLQPGETWTTDLKPHGYAGTNQLSLEASFGVALNLSDRLAYLIRYPHGCVEQTTSGSFPQLYLGKIMQLGEKEQRETQRNVQAGIDRLRQFQLANGAFGYWPGDNHINQWSNIYVGHFLSEAKRLGHPVPDSMLQNWQRFQRERANQVPLQTTDDIMEQSYRLYVLALSGASELGAMNRLREKLQNNVTARYLLAASYRTLGVDDVARQLIAGTKPVAPQYDYYGRTFGSALRDQAILLEAINALKNDVLAADLAESISQQINNSNHWYSTQDLAWSLKSLSGYALRYQGESMLLDWQPDKDKKQSLNQTAAFLRTTAANADQNTKHTVVNRSKAPLRVTLFNTGVAPAGEELAEQNSLEMTVRYTDRDGHSVTPDSLPQGKDILATVTVRNTAKRSLDQLALTMTMPSAWEILNARLFSAGDAGQESAYEYRDIRDDRVMTYFSLANGESRTFKVWLSATYEGRYYLPGWTAEAMYDAKRIARVPGRWIEVKRESAQP